MKHLVYYIIFLCCAHCIKAQITPADMVEKMGRGINLGNTLSAPAEGNWQPAVEETYFDDIASAGFTTVRIPIDFFGTRTAGDTSVYSKASGTSGSYTGSSSNYIVSSAYLDRIEEVISWSLERGLVTILDFHGNTLKDEFLQTYSPKEKYTAYYTSPTSAKRAADNEKFRAIWTAVAERFKDYSYDLLFEVINEPYFYLTDSEMDVLNGAVISIIRNSGSNNLNRNIIITGGSKNSYEAPLQIGTSVLESDTNLIATFHYYWPRAFTASSGATDNDFDWGTAADKAEIDTNFTAVQSWSITNNIPVFLGEFGADNEGGFNYANETYGANGGPESSSRVLYHKYLADKALDLGFSFAAWDAGHKSNKSIYLVEPNRTWVSQVRNALLGIECITSGLIKNADIECGNSNDWNLYLPTGSGAALATKSDETTEVFTAETALKIEVTTAGSTHNKVVLQNQPYVKDISGKPITFRVFAKASNHIENQNFKFRLKVTDASSTVSYVSSIANYLSTTYQLFEYEYTIPQNTKEVEFQLMCGTKAGLYYFDDFYALKDETLSVNDSVNSPIESPGLSIYPNPAKDIVTIRSPKSVLAAKIFNSTGMLMRTPMKTVNTIDISGLPAGVYFLQIQVEPHSFENSKLIIND